MECPRCGREGFDPHAGCAVCGLAGADDAADSGSEAGMSLSELNRMLVSLGVEPITDIGYGTRPRDAASPEEDAEKVFDAEVEGDALVQGTEPREPAGGPGWEDLFTREAAAGMEDATVREWGETRDDRQEEPAAERIPIVSESDSNEPEPAVFDQITPASDDIPFMEPASDETLPAEPAMDESASAEPAVDESASLEPASSFGLPAESALDEMAPLEPASSLIVPAEPALDEIAPLEPASSLIVPAEPALDEMAPLEPASSLIQPAEPALDEIVPAEPALDEMAPLEPASVIDVPLDSAEPKEVQDLPEQRASVRAEPGGKDRLRAARHTAAPLRGIGLRLGELAGWLIALPASLFGKRKPVESGLVDEVKPDRSRRGFRRGKPGNEPVERKPSKVAAAMFWIGIPIVAAAATFLLLLWVLQLREDLQVSRETASTEETAFRYVPWTPEPRHEPEALEIIDLDPAASVP